MIDENNPITKILLQLPVTSRRPSFLYVLSGLLYMLFIAFVAFAPGSMSVAKSKGDYVAIAILLSVPVWGRQCVNWLVFHALPLVHSWKQKHNIPDSTMRYLALMVYALLMVLLIVFATSTKEI